MAGLASGAGDGGAGRPEAARTRAPAELPRGGQRLLPHFRVVALYGAPQDERLGALGQGTPEQAGRRLERQASEYGRPGRPVLPAFELIATVVQRSPGVDGDYSERQPDATIDRYLRAARRRRALLVLDVQPGRAPFMREVRAIERWLREPDVSLALDPEWSMAPGQVPGRQIGSTDAATVNEVSRYLSGLVRRERLPQKLLLVHRFTESMLEDENRLERHHGVALAVNVDGFGNQAVKEAKYRELTAPGAVRHFGFKLFYGEDTGLMSARDVLALRPQPDVVVYE